MKVSPIVFFSILVATEVQASQTANAKQCIASGLARECAIDLHNFNVQSDPEAIELDIRKDGSRVICNRAISKKGRTNYWYGTCGGSNELTVSWLGDRRIHATYTGDDEVCSIHPKQGRDKMECIPKTEEELPDETDALIEDDDDDRRFLRTSKNQQRQLDDGSVIDLMIVWTKQAECEESGYAKTCTPDSVTEAAMQDLANAAVNQANIAFDVSGINSEFRLVHAYRDPNYVEPTDQKTRFNKALYDLRDSGDGKLESVHVERARYRADVVSLFISKGGSCGLAFTGPGAGSSNVNKMYSVVNRNCATSKYTLTHELGVRTQTFHYFASLSHVNSTISVLTTTDSICRAIIAIDRGTTTAGKIEPTESEASCPVGVATKIVVQRDLLGHAIVFCTSRHQIILIMVRLLLVMQATTTLERFPRTLLWQQGVSPVGTAL